jgi:hypothetical protein
VLKNPKVFYREVVHELAADSLGIRGTGMAKVYLELPNGTTFSDLTLLENAVLRGNVEEVVRVFAGSASGIREVSPRIFERLCHQVRSERNMTFGTVPQRSTLQDGATVTGSTGLIPLKLRDRKSFVRMCNEK